jgi:diguanylate cyclase (GGDEF)-like protein
LPDCGKLRQTGQRARGNEKMSTSAEPIANVQGGEEQRLATLAAYGVLDTGRERRFDELTALASHLCAMPLALVSLVDARQLFFKAATGLALSEAPRAGSFCEQAIVQRALFEVPDALADPRFSGYPLVAGEPHIRYYAGAPLVAPNGHAVGTLCVLDFTPRALPIEKYGALQILARQVVAQLELGVLALRDPLTGLYNRYHLHDVLARDLGRTVRRRSRLAVVGVDLDHCRQLNEVYGYDAGDAVLRTLAGTLRSIVRKEDFVCRIAGEEFLIVMPDATIDVVAARAEKLRQQIEALELPLPDGRTCRSTISVGIAAYPEHGDNADALMAEVSHALRLAKAEGCNRVVVAPRGLDFRGTLQSPAAAG